PFPTRRSSDLVRRGLLYAHPGSQTADVAAAAWRDGRARPSRASRTRSGCIAPGAAGLLGVAHRLIRIADPVLNFASAAAHIAGRLLQRYGNLQRRLVVGQRRRILLGDHVLSTALQIGVDPRVAQREAAAALPCAEEARSP